MTHYAKVDCENKKKKKSRRVVVYELASLLLLFILTIQKVSPHRCFLEVLPIVLFHLNNLQQQLDHHANQQPKYNTNMYNCLVFSNW